MFYRGMLYIAAPATLMALAWDFTTLANGSYFLMYRDAAVLGSIALVLSATAMVRTRESLVRGIALALVLVQVFTIYIAVDQIMHVADPPRRMKTPAKVVSSRPTTAASPHTSPQ